MLRLLQYDVLRAQEDYEHEQLAKETQAQREKKEAVAEKNREKRELKNMRKEENRLRAALKKAGEKVAKQQRKVESKEAKVERKKAKALKAKKKAHATKQRQRRKENKEAGRDVRASNGNFEMCFLQLARVPTAQKQRPRPWPLLKNRRLRRRRSAQQNVDGPGRQRHKFLDLIGCLRCCRGIRGRPLESGPRGEVRGGGCPGLRARSPKGHFTPCMVPRKPCLASHPPAAALLTLTAEKFETVAKVAKEALQ